MTIQRRAANYRKLETEIFRKYGAFYAFSAKQMEEQRSAGIKYVHYRSMGLFVPSKNNKLFFDSIEYLTKRQIDFDMKHNSIKEIVEDTCNNYELEYSSDYEIVQDALEDYPIPLDTINNLIDTYLRETIPT